MIVARFVLRMCRFLGRHGRKSKICNVIDAPVPVYSGWEVMNKNARLS